MTGSRMLMPASGPMPGSMPTSVPTRQPRNAYHSTSGRNATEKPSTSESKMVSTAVQNQNRPRSSGDLSRYSNAA